jgi:hypothetical protein
MLRDYVDSFSIDLENSLLSRIHELESDEILRHHKCSDHLDLRVRVFKDGTKHKANQCQVCGEQRGVFFPLVEGDNEIPFFDLSILESRHELRDEISSLYQKLKVNRYGVDESERYIDGLIETLEIIMDSEKENKIFYDIKNLLNKKISNVRKCNEQDLFKNGFKWISDVREIKSWVDTNFSKLFEIDKDKKVRTPHGEDLKVDFCLKAKQSLIDKGFSDEWFAVIVARIPVKDGFSGKAANVFAYASKIKECHFIKKIGGDYRETMKPAFVLLINNFSFSDERFLLQEDLDDSKFSEYSAMSLSARHSGVAVLDVRGNFVKHKDFQFKFIRGDYFTYTPAGEGYSEIIKINKERFFKGVKEFRYK